MLRVALCQMAPVWLNKAATLKKIIQQVEKAADEGAQLVCFGETLLPGYPFWIELTDGAKFESDVQKDFYAHYLEQGVEIGKDDLKTLCEVAALYEIAVYLGVLERAGDRGQHSVYCSLVYISPQGKIESVHRKVMPTYEERLYWAIGDGYGLQVHDLGEFRVGGLNCWENWIPAARMSLHGQGENLHVAVWPGNVRNTVDITRFMAMEGRSYVLSVCGLLRKEDIPEDVPHRELLLAHAPDWMGNGGSCIAAPNGEWIIEPVAEQETLLFAELDVKQVQRERHNFDPSGHYSRPDVFHLNVNRKRQRMVEYEG